MREFKFRYWEKEEETMIYFDFFKVSAGTVYPDIEKTMQYTGLKDKNGVEIYEGDIIRWHDIGTYDYPVTFNDGVFCIDGMAGSNFYHNREEITKKWEVIGHIYE